MLSLSLKTFSVFNFCEAQFEKLGSLRGSAGRTPANNLVIKKEEYLFSLSHHIKILLKKKIKYMLGLEKSVFLSSFKSSVKSAASPFLHLVPNGS